MAKKKSKWMGKARARMKKKGSAGSFTRWCESRGHDGVTAKCIQEGLASKSKAIRKKAGFARSARSVARKRKRKSRK